jgi:Fe2+ transport system protein FeoA
MMRTIALLSSRSIAALCLASVAACSPPVQPPPEDVNVAPADRCVGAQCRDATTSDGDGGIVEMDGEVSDGSDTDAATPSDVVLPPMDTGDAIVPLDGGVVLGRCTGVMAAPIELGSEPRQQARTVFVGQSAAGFFAGYPLQVGGVDKIFFHRLATAGTSIQRTDVVATLPAGRMGGGAFTVTPTGFSSVFHSNHEAGLDIYLQRLDAMGATTGAPVRVVADRELSEDPFVVRTSNGEVVVWRSTMDMLGGQRVLAALVNGSAASAPVSIGPAMTQASSFDVTTDGTRVLVALVARNALGQGNVYLQILDGSGALQRSVELTTGAFVSESVSVAMMGADAVVAWTNRGVDGTFRLRRVNVATGAAGPLAVIGGFGFDVSQASIAADRDGLVAAMRTNTPMGPRIAVGRVGPALVLREGLSAIAPSGPGEQVRIIGRGDGTFGVTWADETPSPMSTTVKFQVVRCP